MSEMTAFTLDEVKALCEAYQSFLLEEKAVLRGLQKACEATEYEKNRIISIARADGLITGKNEAERNEQIIIIIANTPPDQSGYYFLKDWEYEYERALEVVEAKRKAIEAEIGLTKAWLYSQSGIGK